MKRLTADYCERRLLEEKRAAEAASSVEAAVSHRQLARAFLAKARRLRAAAKLPGNSRRPILSLPAHQ